MQSILTLARITITIIFQRTTDAFDYAKPRKIRDGRLNVPIASKCSLE